MEFPNYNAQSKKKNQKKSIKIKPQKGYSARYEIMVLMAFILD